MLVQGSIIVVIKLLENILIYLSVAHLNVRRHFHKTIAQLALANDHMNKIAFERQLRNLEGAAPAGGGAVVVVRW